MIDWLTELAEIFYNLTVIWKIFLIIFEKLIRDIDSGWKVFPNFSWNFLIGGRKASFVGCLKLLWYIESSNWLIIVQGKLRMFEGNFKKIQIAVEWLKILKLNKKLQKNKLSKLTTQKHWKSTKNLSWKYQLIEIETWKL